MKQTVIAAVAACIGMLTTSGLIAYAVAGAKPGLSADDRAETFVSQMIDAEWLQARIGAP